MIESWVLWLLAYLAIPEVGLTSVFIICFIAATLIPMASEPAVFAVVAADNSLFLAVLFVATLGNTLGGIINYWIGYTAKETFGKKHQTRWLKWFEKFGPKMMLIAWVPALGSVVNTLGGWLKLPFWACVLYLALGKGVRYLVVICALLSVPGTFWHEVARLLG